MPAPPRSPTEAQLLAHQQDRTVEWVRNRLKPEQEVLWRCGAQLQLWIMHQQNGGSTPTPHRYYALWLEGMGWIWQANGMLWEQEIAQFRQELLFVVHCPERPGKGGEIPDDRPLRFLPGRGR